MKKCELCNSLAKMYCESDQASLCWDCDARVHAANFLVAKHSRTLLCHLCQSFTPWTASGPRLRPTVSICDNCVVPWSSTSAPPPASTSSNSDQENSCRSDGGVSQSRIAFSLKRTRESAHVHLYYLLSQDNSNAFVSNESAFVGTSSMISRPLKDPKRSMRESQKGLQKAKIPEISKSAIIFEICKLKQRTWSC
ncbi:conserved hypothetical protein [Ricinus communis]|uniref:B box-type domain-containing protein n=1 Tax=Ricinus communis TaxID=3988 RepID=B9SFE7_RICCO|nr:conserved hypothetical protein [Ricinus communis]